MKSDWIERDYQMTNPTDVVRKLTVSLNGLVVCKRVIGQDIWVIWQDLVNVFQNTWYCLRTEPCPIIDSEFPQARVELRFFQKQFHRLCTISFEPVSHVLKSVCAIANLFTDLCPKCRILDSKDIAFSCLCGSARSSGLLYAKRCIVVVRFQSYTTHTVYFISGWLLLFCQRGWRGGGGAVAESGEHLTRGILHLY